MKDAAFLREIQAILEACLEKLPMTVRPQIECKRNRLTFGDSFLIERQTKDGEWIIWKAEEGDELYLWHGRIRSTEEFSEQEVAARTLIVEWSGDLVYNSFLDTLEGLRQVAVTQGGDGA